MNYFISIVSLSFFILFSFCLKEKVPHAKMGDFIVTESNKNHSLLFIRSVQPNRLQLEEVTVPTSHIKNFKNAWQGWLQKGAPGHTSWVVYTLDLEKNNLVSCYSFDRRGWLALEQSFLTHLLSLSLTRVQTTERKKIGPPPLDGEPDHRSSWTPPVVIEGKKLEKPTVDVLKAVWPEDGSQLSQCTVELYFDARRPLFLFPCWIEIKSPHYTHHFKVADSGEGMTSPHTFLPPQPEVAREL